MSIAERIRSRSPFFRVFGDNKDFGSSNDQFGEVESGTVVVTPQFARQIVAENVRREGETPRFGQIEASINDGSGPFSTDELRSILSEFAGSVSAPVRFELSGTALEGSEIGTSDGFGFQTEIAANFDGDVDVFTSADAEAFTDDRLFIVNGTGDQSTVSLYETEAREKLLGEAILRDAGDVSEFVDRLRTTTTDDLDALGIETVGPSQQTRESRQRRETREAARDAAEDAGVDLEEFGIDARADGEVIVQDRDTNQTRTIDPDEDLGDAIADQTDGGSFEPTSSSSTDTTSNVPSVDDLGGGRLAAIVAIGAAVLYGVTQS
jgi:hypothetical protein